MFAVPQEMKIISVTKLNRFAKQILESEIGQVWVSGEISNFTKAASGHWYFTLKDEKAQVRTAMFKGANRSVGFTPKHGDKVVVKANISIYEARGDYQLIAVSMEPEGVGQLKQAFEKLKLALQSEGLFAHEHKKPLPKTISTIGVVTSSTGAAVHDILHVLARRNPAIKIIIYPSVVQGDAAAQSISQQINIANRRQEVDVLVVGRGGGSLEDLWPFNEELVARAIFNSSLPVVSAVGHEVDVTIADFVADIRAATPSAAAEMLSEDKQVLAQQLNALKQKLMHVLQSNIEGKYQNLQVFSQRLHAQHPEKKLQSKQQDFDYLYARLLQRHPHKQIQINQSILDNLTQRLWTKHPQSDIEQYKTYVAGALLRLEQSLKKQTHSAKQMQQSYAKSLQLLSPASDVSKAKNECKQQLLKLHNAAQQLINQKKQILASKSAVLNTVSPLATLSRGYSITLQNDKIVKSISDVALSDLITAKVADGHISATVTSITPNKNPQQN